MKSVFSNPRRVWNAVLKLSLPPKAPPTCEPVFCNSIAVTKMTASTICMYGSTEVMIFIAEYYSTVTILMQAQLYVIIVLHEQQDTKLFFPRHISWCDHPDFLHILSLSHITPPRAGFLSDVQTASSVGVKDFFWWEAVQLIFFVHYTVNSCDPCDHSTYIHR